MPFCFIGKALIDKLACHGNHLGDMPGCPWFYIWRGDQQGSRIFMKILYGLVTQGLNGNGTFARTGIYLVIHIGNIAHIGNL